MIAIEKIIKQARPLHGELGIPGDKSISHRALMLGALCDGKVNIVNLSPGGDVQSTLKCLRALGVQIETRGTSASVQGVGLHGLTAPKSQLDAGNSGTTLRLLSGILAGQTFRSTVNGDESLRKRDMKRVIEPLSQMGASVASAGGFAPLSIQGGALRGIRYAMPVASSQVKSCILLAGLYSQGKVTIVEPVQTRDHTERMLKYLGVPVQTNGPTIGLLQSTQPKARDISVPGDLSSAAFFIAAATLVPNSHLTLRDVGTNPTRVQLLETLKLMGASISMSEKLEMNSEPRGDLMIEHAELRGIEISGNSVPPLIDELPILAVMATQAQGTTVIRDASELRKKESDRIHAVVVNLKKMEGKVEELPDGMKIEGPTKLHGARIDSFGDHRIAMAFAIAGLTAEGETVIEGAEWADISFPGFFDTLDSISN